MRAIKSKRGRFLKLFVPSLAASMAMAAHKEDV
jgi:hypothetical protein